MTKKYSLTRKFNSDSPLVPPRARKKCLQGTKSLSWALVRITLRIFFCQANNLHFRAAAIFSPLFRVKNWFLGILGLVKTLLPGVSRGRVQFDAHVRARGRQRQRRIFHACSSAHNFWGSIHYFAQAFVADTFAKKKTES